MINLFKLIHLFTPVPIVLPPLPKTLICVPLLLLLEFNPSILVFLGFKFSLFSFRLIFISLKLVVTPFLINLFLLSFLLELNTLNCVLVCEGENCKLLTSISIIGANLLTEQPTK